MTPGTFETTSGGVPFNEFESTVSELDDEELSEGDREFIDTLCRRMFGGGPDAVTGHDVVRVQKLREKYEQEQFERELH